MSTKYLVVPNTGQKLTDGDIVMLTRYPGVKWVVHCGWYTYYNYQYSGWYFSSIPSNTVLPANEDDLNMIVVVSTNSSGSGSSCGCDCNSTPPNMPPGMPPGMPPNMSPSVPPTYPAPNPPGPHHPGHPPVHPGPDPHLAKELDRAWISVETIIQRNQLNTRVLPNGKVVRVNNADEAGKPKYYVWNQVKMQWDDMDFGASELYAKKEIEKTVEKLERDIKVLHEGPIWEALPEVEIEEDDDTGSVE